jgi:hypothetical protein
MCCWCAVNHFDYRANFILISNIFFETIESADNNTPPLTGTPFCQAAAGEYPPIPTDFVAALKAVNHRRSRILRAPSLPTKLI